MKRIFSVMMAVAFAFSVAGFAIAAEMPAPKPTKAPPGAQPPAAPAAEHGIPVASKVTGTIEAIDAAAGTFSLKSKKSTMDLKAGEKVQLGDFKVGDKVDVTYRGDTASSVKHDKSSKSKKAAPPAEKK
jgi:hypothetical protein